MVEELITIYIMNREAKKVVTLRLSKQDEDIIKVLAKNDNLSKSAWIRRQLFSKISEYEK